MEYTVLEKSGSDASYDLIIEAITPKPKNGYVINSVVSNNRALEDIIKNTINLDIFKEIEYGIQFNFFQHIPDAWIIEARLESLFERMEKVNRK